MTELRVLRKLAANAALANARLTSAVTRLQPGEWEKTRTSFFPSLKLTMHHLLNADHFYAGALQGRGAPPPTLPDIDTVAGYQVGRAAIDLWYVARCAALSDTELGERHDIHWDSGTICERLDDALLHVFMHGQHHRGQIHAMLSGTSIAPPPQIDEFTLKAESWRRAADLAALGWTEDDLHR